MSIMWQSWTCCKFVMQCYHRFCPSFCVLPIKNIYRFCPSFKGQLYLKLILVFGPNALMAAMFPTLESFYDLKRGVFSL